MVVRKFTPIQESCRSIRLLMVYVITFLGGSIADSGTVGKNGIYSNLKMTD